MKKFMHVGVPTDKVMEGSVYAEGIKTHIVPPETNEFGIEYLRFEKDSCRTVDGRRKYPHRLYYEGRHFNGINGSKIIAYG